MYLIYKNNKLKIYEYKTFFKKLFGLMNKKNISYCIRINNCNSIHTFFMKENIDICITDKTNNIIYLKENLSKNKVILPIKKGKYVYEFPINTIIDEFRGKSKTIVFTDEDIEKTIEANYEALKLAHQE